MGALWAGSIARGEGTKTSDVDLVIIYPRLEHAWRDSFYHDGKFCETFVHDPISLQNFFKADVERGVPSLVNMVFEGRPLLDNPVHAQLKSKAQAILEKGPHPWTKDQVDRSRYTAADLLDDLRGASTTFEITAIGMLLYQHSFEHHRRTNKKWSARGKHIVRTLQREEGTMGEGFLEAFDALFKNGQKEPAIDVVNALFKPSGGPLHIWRQDAPPHR